MHRHERHSQQDEWNDSEWRGHEWEGGWTQNSLAKGIWWQAQPRDGESPENTGIADVSADCEWSDFQERWQDVCRMESELHQDADGHFPDEDSHTREAFCGRQHEGQGVPDAPEMETAFERWPGELAEFEELVEADMWCPESGRPPFTEDVWTEASYRAPCVRYDGFDEWWAQPREGESQWASWSWQSWQWNKEGQEQECRVSGVALDHHADDFKLEHRSPLCSIARERGDCDQPTFTTDAREREPKSAFCGVYGSGTRLLVPADKPRGLTDAHVSDQREYGRAHTKGARVTAGVRPEVAPEALHGRGPLSRTISSQPAASGIEVRRFRDPAESGLAGRVVRDPLNVPVPLKEVSIVVPIKSHDRLVEEAGPRLRGHAQVCARRVRAVAEVVGSLLKLRYEVELDVPDFIGRAAKRCDPASFLSARQLVDDLNSKQDLAFFDAEASRQLSLRVGCRELKGLEELERILRFATSSKSVLALVFADGGWCVDIVDASQTSCADVSKLLGRWRRDTSETACGERDFVGATLMDAEILSVSVCGGREVATVPPQVAEYSNPIFILRSSSSHASSPGLFAIETAPVATLGVMRQASKLLQRSEIDPAGALSIYEKLAGWLGTEPEAFITRHTISAAGVHEALVAGLRRHGCHREVRASASGVLGAASRRHSVNAAAFVECSAPAEVCRRLEQHCPEKDLHRRGLSALECLVRHGGGAAQAIASGALSVTLRSLRSHRDVASVQISGCDFLRCLAEFGGAPLDVVRQAALDVKAAGFPRGTEAHNAAERLLAIQLPAATPCMDARSRSNAARKVLSLTHADVSQGLTRGRRSVAAWQS